MAALRVLLMCLLAQAPSPVASAAPQEVSTNLGQGIHDSIQRGIARLLAMQNRDGSWSPSNFAPQQHWDHRNAQTGLVLYTLLKCNLPRNHPACQQARDYLLAGYPTKTYSISVQMMALAELDPSAYQKRIENLADALLDLRPKGANAWPYPGLRGGGGDLSNTQYAALGLRAAQQAGVKLPRALWGDLAETALDFQGEPERQDDGSTHAPFLYDRAHAPSASMTTAGVAILYLAKEATEDRLPNKVAKKAERAIEQGLAWLASPRM